MSKRIEWIDTAKGIGIILVILGHSEIAPAVRYAIYAFHMPLFALLSGLTFRLPKNDGFFKYVGKEFRRLMLPFFGVLLLDNLLKVVLWELPVADAVTNFVRSIWSYVEDGSIFNLWFLIALFFAKVIFYLLESRCSQISWAIYLLLCYIGMKIPLPLYLDKGLVLTLFLYVGYLFKPYVAGLVERKKAIAVCCGCGFLFLTIGLDMVFGLNAGIASINDRLYPGGFIFII